MHKPTEHPSSPQADSPCPVCIRVYALVNRRFDAALQSGSHAEICLCKVQRRQAGRCFQACWDRNAGAPCPVPPWFVCGICAANLAAAVIKRRMAKGSAETAAAAADADLALAQEAAENCARGGCAQEIPW